MTGPGGRSLGAVRRLRRSSVVERTRTSLWFLPSLFMAGAGLAAAVLPRVHVDESSTLGHLVFPGGAESARGILQVIAGSVITVTGVVFSLTVVTLQLASSQFSPRLLRTFLRDVSNQIVLAIFLATFTYALLVLRAVRSGPTPEEDVVPALAITGAYVLTVASVIALVYFIDHIARSIRIDSLMREVNKDTVKAIEDLYGADDGSVVPPDAIPPTAPGAAMIVASGSGFVQGIDLEALEELAEAGGLVLRLEPAAGDRVVEGGPLAWVWRSDEYQPDADLISAVRTAIKIGFERTMQQDIGYGFRQLVDVAVKALSPGVNDPTTAVHAIGHLATLLVLLAQRPVGPRIVTTAGGGLIVAPAMDVPAYLGLACGQIRRYGAREPMVMVELLRMLRDVARCDLDSAHRSAVERETVMVVAAADRETVESGDLEPVHALEREVRELLLRPANRDGT